MTEDAFWESIRNMRNHEGNLERAGNYWSDEDRERLRQMFDEGVGISEISLRLQRTEPAVFQQIEKMDLYQRKDRPRRRRGTLRNYDYNCHCPNCEVDEQHCPRYINGQQERGQSDA